MVVSRGSKFFNPFAYAQYASATVTIPSHRPSEIPPAVSTQSVFTNNSEGANMIAAMPNTRAIAKSLATPDSTMRLLASANSE